MLRFLYSGDYDDSAITSTVSAHLQANIRFLTYIWQDPLTLNTRAYIFADKWDILGSKEVAAKKYGQVPGKNLKISSFTATLSIIFN